MRSKGCAVLVFALGLVATAGCARPRPAPPRNLLLISLDTVRRDHLSVYSYQRATTPALEKLAREAVVFERAFSSATNTEPSHLTLFTGLSPDQHGVWWNGTTFKGDCPTLASTLHAAGFATAGFVSGETMKQVATNLGYGFDLYDDQFEAARRSGRTTVARAVSWLRERPSGERFFLFVHLFDAHGAYWAPRSLVDRFHSDRRGPELAVIPAYQQQTLDDGQPATHLGFYIDRYDAALRWQDILVDRLLRAVDLDSTLVVVVSDHGESLDERQWKLDHGGEVWDEQMRVPVLMRVRGLGARRVETMVGLVDLAPTILDLLGVPAPDARGREGTSLVPYLEAGGPAPRRDLVAFAEVHPERLVPLGSSFDTRRGILALRDDRWKVVLIPGREQDLVQLFDLEHDPGEQHDVAAEWPSIRTAMLRRLAARLAPRQPEARSALDDKLARQLRSLGYVAH
jgi:arylsulfatase